MSSIVETRALVCGDVMLDRYIHGTVARISPEAPVPVVRLVDESVCPGGAANVATSIAVLESPVALFGIVGIDQEANQLEAALRANSRLAFTLVPSASCRTISKSRVVTAAGRHQLLRLDQDGDYVQFARCAVDRLSEILQLIRQHDVVVLSDYDKGALPSNVLRPLIQEARARRIPCIIDPKKHDFGAYRGATIITPNLQEAERALGTAIRSDSEVASAGRQLSERYDIAHVIITRGADGMTRISGGASQHYPAEMRRVADVSGAGDTVVAALAAATLEGLTIDEACRMATTAAGIAVTYPGTYAVSAAELRNAVSGGSTKVCSRADATRRIESLRGRGGRVVFTNGCFDILHSGHLESLERAKKYGDVLVIGLNSDTSVRALKGPSRPIISDHERAQLLSGMTCVDLIVIFDELTPEELIRDLRPDVLVKGADYINKPVAGADFIRSLGGEVVFIPLVEGRSTTAILERAAGGVPS